MVLTLNLKKALHDACKKVLVERMENANIAMQAAQEAANGEEKSSAGDKYETSRAMGHRDRDMYARQLVDFKDELVRLEKMNLKATDEIRLGSLIELNESLYFIAVGLGKVKVNDMEVIVISKDAPISRVLMTKKEGDIFSWNEKQWKIGKVL